MSAKQRLTEAGLQDSHWGKRIIRAEKRGGFTKTNRLDAFRWTTCACGKADPRIPRWERGESRYRKGCPKDRELADLGSQFSEDVDNNRYLAAAYTLIAIEKRASEVLAEVVK